MSKFYRWESPSSLHAARIRDRCVYWFGRNSAKFIISLLTWNLCQHLFFPICWRNLKGSFGLYKETWTPTPRNKIKAEMGLSGKVLKPGADLPFQQWRHYRDRDLWVQATILLAITLLCPSSAAKKKKKNKPKKHSILEVRVSLHGSAVTSCLSFFFLCKWIKSKYFVRS